MVDVEVRRKVLAERSRPRRLVGLGRLAHRDGAVIVAMLIAWVMKMAVDHVVGVVAVRHRLVRAPGTVHVVGRVRPARVLRRTSCRVHLIDLKLVRMRLATRNVITVAALNVVLVIAMRDRRVAASGTVGVGLALMTLVIAHGRSPSV
jgi:hypothetical protein